MQRSNLGPGRERPVSEDPASEIASRIGQAADANRSSPISRHFHRRRTAHRETACGQGRGCRDGTARHSAQTFDSSPFDPSRLRPGQNSPVPVSNGQINPAKCRQSSFCGRHRHFCFCAAMADRALGFERDALFRANPLSHAQAAPAAPKSPALPAKGCLRT